jgi:ribosomal-protein-alanine N-acetyltransferase
MVTKTKDSRKNLDNLEIVIAPMRKRHINDILQIEKASFPTPWARISFLQELQNDLAVYIVVLSKGKVIGYAGMWLILDEAHITNVAVHPDYRQMGIGRLLMRQLILKAAVLGAARMTLEVRVSNTPACQLYKGLGFVQEGLRKGYYTDTNEDALIMWKEI